MLNKILTLVLIWLLPVLVTGTTLRDEQPPNILLIIADDMGYSDISCFGSEIPTPNLDKLAENGLRLTRFYNTARCSPSRASILTGLYPHQAGVGFLTSDNSRELRRILGPPGYTDNLNDKCVTIAEALKPVGYKTYLSGKWHVGQERPHWPVDRGFDQSIAVHRGYHYFDPTVNQYSYNDQILEPEAEDFYATDFFTGHAMEFIEQHDTKQPFFLYLGYTAPHWPIHAPEKEIARFEGKYLSGWDALREERFRRMKKMDILEQDVSLSPRDNNIPEWDSLSDHDKVEWDRKMAVYAAQISIMDKGIGRIMDLLRDRGMLDNTLVMFLSDNGGSAERIKPADPDAPIGSRNYWGSYGAWASLSNTPFRLFKHYVHEGGIRSPFIVNWPRGIKSGNNRILRSPCHVIDIMPTCLEVANAEYPSEFKGKAILPTPGKSMIPYFNGKVENLHDSLYWEHEGNRALLEGDWKLVSRLGQDWELYRINQDPTEQNDLSRKFPETVITLSTKWQSWADEAGVVPWTRTGRFPKIPDYNNVGP